MIIYVEGSNCSGKTTLINKLKDLYGYRTSKSVPNWFQNYIPFARTLMPEIQRKMYELGHISAYETAKHNNSVTIFDRSYISTFIRLSFQEKKSVEECIKDIEEFPYKPDMMIILCVPYEVICNRYSMIHNKEIPNYDFYMYENEIFKKIAKKYDNILLVSNSNELSDDTTLNNTNQFIRKYYLKGRK